jgi:hypothetical protein
MRIRKRTVSETETHRLVTMRGHSIVAWCRGCEQEVAMVALECAEKFLGAGVPSLRQHIAKSAHFAVTDDKKLWVCCRWLCQLR